MAELRKLKDEIKRDLIEYFDSIRSQVDVRAQILLYEFETNKLESTSNFNQKIIKYINKCMIDKIYQKLDESIDNINDYFIKHVNILDTDKDQIKLKALKNDCVYYVILIRYLIEMTCNLLSELFKLNLNFLFIRRKKNEENYTISFCLIQFIT